MRTVRLMRGCPGSGKSFRARAAKAACPKGTSAIIVSADDYFTDKDGTYTFNGSKLTQAHQQCFMRFIDAVYAEIDLVIVDNTNIKLNEFEHYLKVASIGGYNIQVDQALPKDDDELVMWNSRCIHGVPLDRMRNRAEQWQDLPDVWRHQVEFIYP